jgi:hypothetical protein
MRFEVLYPEVAISTGTLPTLNTVPRGAGGGAGPDHAKTPRAFLDAALISYYAPDGTGPGACHRGVTPYKNRLPELIDRGMTSWPPGNALEVFIKRIDNEDGSCIEALGLLSLWQKADANRYNAYTWEVHDFKIVGLKSQFCPCYGMTVRPCSKHCGCRTAPGAT